MPQSAMTGEQLDVLFGRGDKRSVGDRPGLVDIPKDQVPDKVVSSGPTHFPTRPIRPGLSASACP